MRDSRIRLYGGFLISLGFINKYTRVLSLFVLQQTNKRSTKPLKGDNVEPYLGLALMHASCASSLV